MGSHKAIKLTAVKIELGKYEDILSDQNKIIQQADALYSDIVAMANKLLPLAGRAKTNEKEALRLVQSAKDLGDDKLAKNLNELAKRSIGDSIIKASDSITASAKAYKL